MRLFRHFLLLSTVAVLAPHPAFAYIDPGTISMVIQGLFAIVFGAATTWVMRPWQILKSLFRRRKPAPSKPETVAPCSASDSTTEQR